MEKDFLQSEVWRKFQEKAGRKTHNISSDEFSASIIEHNLPIVGRYFYVPRGPVCHPECSEARLPVRQGSQDKNRDSLLTLRMTEIINLAKKEKAGWVRFDPENEEMLEMIKTVLGNAYMRSIQKHKIIKAPHDMQPKEIFVIDITKTEEEILAEMKSKTRYNLRLAEKKGVRVIVCHSERSEESRNSSGSFAGAQDDKYIDEFLRLTKIMAARQGIVPHPDEYYRKMFETIPDDILKLYVAEYEGKIIAANVMVFYGDTAIYLHGASDDKYKNLMAPYLLQWQAIKDAKLAGCERYDFGGVKMCHSERSEESRDSSGSFAGAQDDKGNSWAGITRFKLGFSPNTKPVEFTGSYDIIVSPMRYGIYRIIQKAKSLAK